MRKTASFTSFAGSLFSFLKLVPSGRLNVGRLKRWMDHKIFDENKPMYHCKSFLDKSTVNQFYIGQISWVQRFEKGADNLL
jgi:hypothetical protein